MVQREQWLEELPDHLNVRRYRLHDVQLLSHLFLLERYHAHSHRAYTFLPSPKFESDAVFDESIRGISVWLARHHELDSTLSRHKRFLLFRSCRFNDTFLLRIPGHEVVQDGWHYHFLCHRHLDLPYANQNALYHRLYQRVCLRSVRSSLRWEVYILLGRQTHRLARS